MEKTTGYITFETRNYGNIDMSKETFCRWLCLMEGMQIMEQKAEHLGIDLKSKDWVKPLAFESYVSERFESMMLDLNYDEKHNLLGRTHVHFDSTPEYSIAQ